MDEAMKADWKEDLQQLHLKRKRESTASAESQVKRMKSEAQLPRVAAEDQLLALHHTVQQSLNARGAKQVEPPQTVTVPSTMTCARGRAQHRYPSGYATSL